MFPFLPSTTQIEDVLLVSYIVPENLTIEQVGFFLLKRFKVSEAS